MNLIKLNAVDSTNEFLKALSLKQTLENFTIVTAEYQTHGKGQMGAAWNSEQGKNLIMSVFIKDLLLDINQIYSFNIAVALAVIKGLEKFTIPNLSIKWPNDIMSGNYKIGGILIENTIKSDGTLSSILGLGLNINQHDFDKLPNASSLSKICGTLFDKEEILVSIVSQLKLKLTTFGTDSNELWRDYSNKLFKKGVVMPFKDKNERHFMGIIQGVSHSGKLQVLLENETISEFNIKEIQLVY